ncbi:MAG: hypothetical protein ACT4P4_03250, partial [Betaproteobacteria bacterium]
MTETDGDAAAPRLARNALPLADPDGVIVASEGFVDVFAVASGAGAAPGALHPVRRARERQPVYCAVP